MKRIVFILLLVTTIVNSQQQDLTALFPENKNIKKGTLENGLTYYLHHTKVEKDAASFYIVQNVGSVLEKENEQGLAHFLEHMAFNGTKNFPKKGVINTLEKYGLKFGKNINAYTGWDKTVYRFEGVPTTIKGAIDNSLLILHDWANNLSLEYEEIDAERGVVKEEWRTRLDGYMRMYTKSSPSRFNNSIYAYRLPIGKPEIIESFKYNTLEKFYQKWYRPDLQAIVVIGDIDVALIEQKIKKLFSSIVPPKNKPVRNNITIADNFDPIFELSSDKELFHSNIDFTIRHPNSLENETVLDFKKELTIKMLVDIVNDRIKTNIDSNSPHKSGGISFSNFVRLHNQLSINVAPKPNKQKEAFKAILTEVIRAKTFGFSENEIKRSAANLLFKYSKKIEQLPHAQILESIKNNFLDNTTIRDPEKEFELAKKIIKNIDSDALKQALNELYTKENRTILAISPENEKGIAKTEVLNLIKAVENDKTITPYKNKFIEKPLFSEVKIEKGKIISEKYNDKIKATTFKLSNGVKVHYKISDKLKDKLKLEAVSLGGLSVFPNKDLPSAEYALVMANMSGLHLFSQNELNKTIANKEMHVFLGIHDYKETINGQSNHKDLETMFQLMYLKLVKPRFDKNAYTTLYNNLKSSFTNISKDILGIKENRIKTEVYGNNNPKIRIKDQSFLNDFSFEKMKTIYKDRFKDLSDFEFFIVGDLPIDSIKPYIETYIASIPSIDRKETFINSTPKRVSNHIDKDIFLELKTPISSVSINYEKEIKYTFKNVVLSKILADILELTLSENLREKEGGTYGVQSMVNLVKIPTENGSLLINFDCNPDKTDKLIKMVYKEIDKIKKGKISIDYLNKIKANYIKTIKENKTSSDYDLHLLVNYFRSKEKIINTNFEDIINNTSLKDVKEFTKKLLKKAKHYEIVFKPIPNKK